MKNLFKDKSFEENNILKLIIYTFSFISFCMALILFYLLPTLKEYKEAIFKEKSQLAMLRDYQHQLNLSNEKVALLRKDHNHTLSQFEQKFDSQAFLNFLNKYFSQVKLKELQDEKNDPYLGHIYNIEALMSKPKDLYDFIENSKGFKHLIQIVSPMQIQAKKNAIEIRFNVKIYGAY